MSTDTSFAVPIAPGISATVRSLAAGNEAVAWVPSRYDYHLSATAQAGGSEEAAWADLAAHARASWARDNPF